MIEIIYEEESYKIIGACISVHKILGNGILEAVYQEALAIEFRNHRIPFEQEKGLDLYFRNIKLKKKYVVDFICFGKIILELKAVAKTTVEHDSQLLNYLNATGLKLGLLINFGEKSLKYKRFII
jgi:GxxExxY protein